MQSLTLHVFCDHSRHLSKPEIATSGMTVEACRAQAVAAGWLIAMAGGADLCPGCRALLEAAKSATDPE